MCCSQCDTRISQRKRYYSRKLSASNSFGGAVAQLFGLVSTVFDTQVPASGYRWGFFKGSVKGSRVTKPYFFSLSY